MNKRLSTLCMILIFGILFSPISWAYVPYGQALGSFWGVEIDSNGSNTGNTEGIGDYQCTEYVQRFLEKFGEEPPEIGSYYMFTNSSNHDTYHLTPYNNGGAIPPIPGDIICFDSNSDHTDGYSTGHIGVIAKVDLENGVVTVAHQNWDFSAFKTIAITRSYDGNFTIGKWGNYDPYGWVRHETMNDIGKLESGTNQAMTIAVLECFGKYASKNYTANNVGVPFDDDGIEDGDIYLHEWGTSDPDWQDYYIQNFSTGVYGECAIIFSKDTNNAYLLRDPFWDKFTTGDGTDFGPSMKMSGYELGFPINDQVGEQYIDGVITQNFNGGYMKWESSYPYTLHMLYGTIVGQFQGTGNSTITSSILSIYNASGGSSALGSAYSDAGNDPYVHEWRINNWLAYVQNFNGGSLGESIIIYNPQVHDSFLVTGEFWNFFRFGNGVSHHYGPMIPIAGKELGFPITQEGTIAGVKYQDFTNGRVYEKSGGGVDVYSRTGYYCYSLDSNASLVSLFGQTPSTTAVDLQFCEIPSVSYWKIWQDGAYYGTYTPSSKSMVLKSASDIVYEVTGLSTNNIYGFQVNAYNSSDETIEFSNNTTVDMPNTSTGDGYRVFVNGEQSFSSNGTTVKILDE
jgi:hypothetical protein